MKKRILALVLCILMLSSTIATLASCGGNGDGGKTQPDALVLMSEELDGLFNPFYSTTAADGTIVSMTQIGMLTNKYVNGEIEEAFGDDEATVVLDYESVYAADKDETTYTFVIKNGIKYSDGKPLTMHDVLFNLYVYLDPVYTGSSTMYSTDIKGLKAYRTQSFVDDDDTSADNAISNGALTHAKNRIDELINLFKQVGETKTQGSYYADYNTMIEAINNHVVNDGYIEAIYTEAEIAEYEKDGTLQAKAKAQLKADYENTVKLFKEELERDYNSAKESYTEDPYKSAPVKETANGATIRTGFDDIISFMYAEGFVTIKYEEGADGKIDRTKIKEAILDYSTDVVKDKASAIKYVYDSKVSSELNIILSYWATANTLRTEYSAKGKEILLASNAATSGLCPSCEYQNNKGDKVCKECGESLLAIPNISGIVSLGHTNNAGTQINVNGTVYTVANDHNKDGTVKTEGEYDILQITINGVDPKAVWNFAFAVAPQHYYSPNQVVDISKNRFGVEYGSFDFMKNEIQSTQNIKVPVGAGAYQATNAQNTDDNLITGFYSNNIVYFKRNENFHTVAKNIENAKIEKVRYRVTSTSNALNDLATGAVHYISPQYTPYNMEQLQKLADKGIVNMSTDQLGYGYIGINAGKVEDLELRKAIMAAMNTALGKQYYVTGTAETIYWPMSLVSWAYPMDGNSPDKDNGKEYIAINFNREEAITMIKDYMAQAGVSAGDSKLKITFTIAGANVDDHPCYSVFIEAQSILNECGWDISVVPDTQALTKLSTGSLAVWAAAWGSTIDPDMYQVYHKDSTATSTLAWGYNAIKTMSGYEEEQDILNKLSEVIDLARETDDKDERKRLYKEAMGYVLDLAVELPVYQRDVLYAFDSNILDKNTLPSASELNPYSSPLDRIWELDFAK